MVVDNQAGATGSIGARIVVRAAPDGYTLLLGYASQLTISPSISEVGYDTVKDLAPVARFTVVPYTLVMHPSVPAKDLRELVAYAKARPGQLNYASAGQGSLPHLAAELFKLETGIDLLHVPYKGGDPATHDLVAGRVQVYFSGIASVVPFVNSGKIRSLAVTTSTRSVLLPNVLTTAEAGVPGLEVSSWNGVLAPAKTPDAIVNRLYTAVAKVTDSPEMKNYLLTQGAEAGLLTPAQFGDLIRVERATWAKVIKTANIKAD